MIQKFMNNKMKKYTYQMVVVSVVALALLGTFLPGWLLVWQSHEKMNMVSGVPVEYYSPANLAVARNASANLGTYQKLQLITGRWESNVGEADSYERTMENYEAVELAKEGIEKLYQESLYPVSLVSDYENWYSWEAEFCKVVDATFHTYAAYYWRIFFSKYDGSEQHQVYMLEDGTIFLAKAWEEAGIESKTITKISEASLERALGLGKIVKGDVAKENKSLEEYLAFSDMETMDLKWMDLMHLQINEQGYYVLQANSSNHYLFSLQPVD